MKKKLILAQIPDNFNPDFHIPISPACFIGKEDIYPGFENLDYINIVPNKQELVRLDKLTTQEALFWVNTIAKKYNSDSFEKHSFRFWKTIYFPWLGMVIPWIYRKQLLVNKLIKKYNIDDLEIKLIDFNGETVKFNNEIEFIIDGFWNREINEWVFSKFLEKKLSPDNLSYKKNLSIKSDKKTMNRFQKKKNIKTSIIEQFHKIFYRCNRIYGFSLSDEAFFHLLLSFKPAVSKRKNNTINFPEKGLINWDIDVLRVLDILIPESLKNLNLENRALRNYRKGKIMNYSNNLYYDINRKIDAAFAYEKNEIVFTTQHGGHNYGSAFTFEFGKEIEFKSDYFVSWGWKEKELNIIDLPSPLLSKQNNTHKKTFDNIIFVGTDMAGFQTRFDSHLSELSLLKYRKNKIAFFKGLSSSSFKKILYRPYPEKETSFLDSKYIIKKFPGIKIHKGNLNKDMQECSLLVLDHPGTTWNIAMAMNTPLILFWNRDHFPFNEEADKYLDKFRDLGIYFEDPEKAALRLNELNEKYDDLSVWWNQKEIQDLRKEWMYKYARTDKNWFWIWAKTLWKLK